MGNALTGSALDEVLARAQAAPFSLSRDELAALLRLRPGPEREAFHAAARAVRDRVSGPNVYLRGLLEIGTRCRKDCLYCGLRRSNSHTVRYEMAPPEIVRLAVRVYELRLGSVVLQSGEVQSAKHTAVVEEMVRRIRSLTSPDFAIVLSLGEQSEETYARWRAAGADRYLLRIETSSSAFYRTLHPATHRWEVRKNCLSTLKRLGYQLGTGVMMGLPGQTAEMLADDIIFYRRIHADMIGMGPFLPHDETPIRESPLTETERLELGVNMVAATRLYLHTCNIAATTALQALSPQGREQALLAGANVLMPNFTDDAHRRAYQLYPGKPIVDEVSGEEPLSALEASIRSIGLSIAWGLPGTPPHYLADRNPAE